MATDPRLKAAIAHWGPRFVANGVVLTDFEEVTGLDQQLRRMVRAPGRRARRITKQLGREALARGHQLTAGECLQRAGVYYHFAVVPVRQRRAADEGRAHEGGRMPAGGAAVPAPPGERVRIPYEGKMLAGILRKPAGYDKPPVVVMAVGLDSTKEEGDAYEAPFLARGMATLIFEGPGQGEAQYDFAIRGDYEVPVKAVLDYVATRRDLDIIAHRHVGRQPRRLLRAARRRVRQAHQGLHRARRAVQLGRRLGQPAGPDARSLPRAQPLRHAGRGEEERRDAVARRRGAATSPARSSS